MLVESIAKDALLLLSSSPAKPLNTPSKETTSFSYLSLLKDDSSSQPPVSSLVHPQLTDSFTTGLPSFMMTSTQPSIVIQSPAKSTSTVSSSTKSLNLPILQITNSQETSKPTITTMTSLLHTSQNEQQQQQFFEKSYQNLNNQDVFPLILPKTISSHHPLPPQQVLQPVVMNSFVAAPKNSNKPSIYNQLNMKQSDTKVRQCERKRRSRQRKSKEASKVATRFLSFQPPPQHIINQQQPVQNNETQQNEPKVIVSDMLNTTPFFNVKVLDVQGSPIQSPLKVSSTTCNSILTTTINIAEISPPTILIPKKGVVENVKKSCPSQTPRSILKTSKTLQKGKRQPQLILPHKEIPQEDVLLESPLVVVDKLPVNSSNKIKIESQKNDNSSSKDNNSKVFNKKLMKVKFNFKSPRKRSDDDYTEKLIRKSFSPSTFDTNQERDVINKDTLQSPDSLNVDNFLEPSSSSDVHTGHQDTRTSGVDQQTASHTQQENILHVDNLSKSSSKGQVNNELKTPISKSTNFSQDHFGTRETEKTSLKITQTIENKISDLVVTEPSSISQSDKHKTVEKELPCLKSISIETQSASLESSRKIGNGISESAEVVEPNSISGHDQGSTSLKTSHIDFSYSLLHEDTVDASDRLKDIIKEMKNNEKKKIGEKHSSTVASLSVESRLPPNVNVIPKKSFVSSPFKTKHNPGDKHTSKGSQSTLLEPSFTNTNTLSHRTPHEHDTNNAGQTPEYLASPARSDVKVSSSVMMSSPYAESIDSLDSSPFRGGRKRKLSDASDKVSSTFASLSDV